jgi:hypothetical protein
VHNTPPSLPLSGSNSPLRKASHISHFYITPFLLPAFSWSKSFSSMPAELSSWNTHLILLTPHSWCFQLPIELTCLIKSGKFSQHLLCLPGMTAGDWTRLTGHSCQITRGWYVSKRKHGEWAKSGPGDYFESQLHPNCQGKSSQGVARNNGMIRFLPFQKLTFVALWKMEILWLTLQNWLQNCSPVRSNFHFQSHLLSQPHTTLFLAYWTIYSFLHVCSFTFVVQGCCLFSWPFPLCSPRLSHRADFPGAWLWGQNWSILTGLEQFRETIKE